MKVELHSLAISSYGSPNLITEALRGTKNKSNQCSKPDLSLFMTKEKVKKKSRFLLDNLSQLL